MASATRRDAPFSAGNRCSIIVRQSTDLKRAALSTSASSAGQTA
jgi:hypothetical protein